MTRDKLLGLAVEAIVDRDGVPYCGRARCMQYDVVSSLCEVDPAKKRAVDHESVCVPKVAAQAVQLESLREDRRRLASEIHTLRATEQD